MERLGSEEKVLPSGLTSVVLITNKSLGKYPSKPPSPLKVVSYTCKKYRCQGNDRAA
jgi:hypothetical protein